MIIKKGKKFILLSHDGKKVLGEFPTKEEAIKREKQIMFLKHKKGEKK